MAKLIVKHRVADFDSWKKGFLAHAPERRKSGFTGHLVLRDAGDPNLITCVLSTTDLTRAKAFLGRPELREAMSKAGVQGPPDIAFCEDALEETYSVQ
jgi:hypothetical protein